MNQYKPTPWTAIKTQQLTHPAVAMAMCLTMLETTLAWRRDGWQQLLMAQDG